MAAKYKVGEYVTREDSIILEVQAVIENDMPLYGVFGYKEHHLHWDSEYELENKGFKKVIPDFERWNKVQAGDLIHCGVTKERSYCKVIARVGNLVMLSTSTLTKKNKEDLERITSQLEELTDGEITGEKVAEKFGFPETNSEAYKTAADKWWSIHDLALMNWELLVE